ncbi:sulfate adenylyltransferase [Candidatus Kaiserbacteria bacterium RIFCSPHIGHO2_01_FULL_51_33]|uniref:Pyruvate kinase n=1 Tax=Candidatus Kaiserbacteria bacterium RIFCSPLOWO2_01_FULL_51_21 TaxID=1798508 RepID=A0A1F6EED7_9BACT|nr:MAG: sulfate adenylyltransferase [Candidatus Kaiserbacteria bacterium RIFCSPHIGHO2_01_FULL_51_33]OGG71987.1 MAG: sulfate adenylyltransferase [Candidatus Kaiserbacteria bacterium RIFCSPLOWO2_01_FULL_51_21]
MKKQEKTKIIVTLGPSTNTEEMVRTIKSKGVDFVRVNMSHSSLADQRHFMRMAKKIGIPFVLDTEGSQIRTGVLKNAPHYFEEGALVTLTNKEIVGNGSLLTIRPREILKQLEVGDIVYCDFDSLILRIHDVNKVRQGKVVAQVIAGGLLGNNKGVVVQSALADKHYDLPTLSPKDKRAIKIALAEGVQYIAASFMRSGAAVREVRKTTKGKMKIISKIECIDGLQNLKGIIAASDFLLIDRGDLSKEIPIERIPFMQKLILQEAAKTGKGVFVATNLLETMVEKSKPTRAEVHDIVDTLLEGAYGVTLAAETAVGKNPIACINMLNRIIEHTKKYGRGKSQGMPIAQSYLDVESIGDSLVEPHGGKLVNGLIEVPQKKEFSRLLKIKLSDEQYMDAEQIAIGTFSPLTGFMGKRDVESVLNSLRLKDGIVWPLPIVLDVSKEVAAPLKVGKKILLTDKEGVPFGMFSLKEKYSVNKEEYARTLYETTDEKHPGVRAVEAMGPVFLAGGIKVFRRRPSSHKQYELTPRQARRLFEDRGWRTVVGFHTRNVPHRGHEFIQLEALRKTGADGLFIHPVIGKKKSGDFEAAAIVQSYEKLMRICYPKETVVFGTYATFSRYAGPREALFTALCRKNFGCSHFIVGRDHTGVGDFYHPKASHAIFDRVGDIGITPVRFDKVFYSKKLKSHVHEGDAGRSHAQKDMLLISGTEARKMLLRGKMLPQWFMRPELSKLIIGMLKKGEKVFVE